MCCASGVLCNRHAARPARTRRPGVPYGAGRGLLRAGSGFIWNFEPAPAVYRGRGQRCAPRRPRRAGTEEEHVEAVISVLAVLFLFFVALGTYATIKAVGAAKRGVDRTLTQARRTVEDHTLRAKSFAQFGPAAEIAQLRLKLRTSMRATQDTLHAGAVDDESLKESLGLFRRLSAHGHELDEELKRLEAEPDRATLVERLPGCASAPSGSPSPRTTCAGRPATAPAGSPTTIWTPSVRRSTWRRARCGTGPPPIPAPPPRPPRRPRDPRAPRDRPRRHLRRGPRPPPPAPRPTARPGPTSRARVRTRKRTGPLSPRRHRVPLTLGRRNRAPRAPLDPVKGCQARRGRTAPARYGR